MGALPATGRLRLAVRRRYAPLLVPALDLLDGWDAPHAAAAVMGRGRGVLAVHGDGRRPSRWASVTKMLTAVAVLVAVEEGTLALDDQAGPPGSTIRHLLAHASGLAFDRERVVAAPGERRIYSNAGFEALAAAVAQRAAMPFETYLREAVLAPLGLQATRLEGTAAAGLVGPLDDLVRFARELMAPTLVSRETFAVATAVAFPGLGGVLPGIGRYDPLDWGLGFELRDGKASHWTGRRCSPETFGHFGGSGSLLWVDPAAGVALAALSGREFGAWARAAWPALSDRVLDDYGA